MGCANKNLYSFKVLNLFEHFIVLEKKMASDFCYILYLVLNNNINNPKKYTAIFVNCLYVSRNITRNF